MSVLMPKTLVLLPGFCAVLGLSPAVAAQEPVYKWTDAAGNTTYSDQPPPAGNAAEQLQLPAAPSAEEAEAARQRTAAMQRQTEKLAGERRLREQRAVEAAQQAALAAQAEPAVDVAEDDEDYNEYPYYVTPRNYPNTRPIIRPRPPRPTQPIVRPGIPRR